MLACIKFLSEDTLNQRRTLIPMECGPPPELGIEHNDRRANRVNGSLQIRGVETFLSIETDGAGQTK
jgi:hypothetical protein